MHNIYWYDISKNKDGSDIVSIHKVTLENGEQEIFPCPQYSFANVLWQNQFGKPFRIIVNASREEALAYLNDIGKMDAIEIQLSTVGGEVVDQSVRQLTPISAA